MIERDTELQITSDPAIAYSTCYAQVFSRLFFGDCLIESDKIETGSVDLILTDLPYGTMKGQSKTGIYHNGEEKHEWDSIIDTDKIMQIANRILRKNGKMILFAQEPFTRELINKAIPNVPFNYRAIWLKDTLGSFMRSKSALLYRTEDILIFSKTHDLCKSHPLIDYFMAELEKTAMTQSDINKILGNKMGGHYFTNGVQFCIPTAKNYNKLQETGYFKKPYNEIKQIDDQFKNKFASTFNLWQGGKYKDNVFEYKRDRDNHHPTQKPVLLLEDLIKTFSNENDLVVDLTMGSGSTGVACKNTNRSFIGIEKDEAYFKIAEQRINARTLF